MSDTVQAWHFVGETLRDGLPIPSDGEWLIHDGPVLIRESGLHASERLIDALSYAPGATLCRVECGDIVRRENDKFVCRRRRILWRLDTQAVLRAFARWAALQVIHLWSPTEAVVEYLRKGHEKDRAAARAAAEAAAREAAWEAVEDAAWSAARDAAMAAAWDAARAAARDAAWAAAWDAARAAARDAARAAARAAAWDAARDAARASQNTQLEKMVVEARDRRKEWSFDE